MQGFPAFEEFILTAAFKPSVGVGANDVKVLSRMICRSDAAVSPIAPILPIIKYSDINIEGLSPSGVRGDSCFNPFPGFPLGESSVYINL